MKSFFDYNFSKFSKKPSISRNQFLFQVIKMLMLKELRLEEDHEEVIFLILLLKT